METRPFRARVNTEVIFARALTIMAKPGGAGLYVLAGMLICLLSLIFEFIIDGWQKAGQMIEFL